MIRVRFITNLVLFAALLLSPHLANAQAVTPRPHPCRIESTNFRGWRAQQLANDWVTLTIVPQLGGRLMQVAFAGHSYLFINPRYEGKYIPPSEAAKGQWINYGGDKIWPLPEGTEDEQHWPGPIADNLDDGDYSFKILFPGPVCAIRLEGPADPRTGLQYSRDVSIGSDSPEISFHAVMKNASTHPIQWSVQSVSQYDTADPRNPGSFNHDFWAFTPANRHSAYPGGYHVRTGLPDDPSFSVTDDLFTLHWLNLQSEVWIDSPGDWVAVLDAATSYAMIERFTYAKPAQYPGDASVIFYKNGAPPKRKKNPGEPPAPPDPDDALFYMEAELNSPLVRLEPGATYAMDTKWFPARIPTTRGTGVSPVPPEITVTSAAVVTQPLQASTTPTGVLLSASLGIFFPGTLVAHLYDEHGVESTSVLLQAINPADPLNLRREIKSSPATVRVSLHLVDPQGTDRGLLGEARVTPPQQEGHSIDVRPEDLLVQPPAANWISYNGDYSGRRFSTLAEITPANVANLRAQWVFHKRDVVGMEVTPVVVNGIMFITSANDAFALDARTGRSIWHYSRPVTEGLIDDASEHHNRGVALWHSKVFLETDNAHLLCLDARSGHLLWDVPYAEGNKNYGATSAPLVVKNKVLVGTSGGDDGVRGFLAAFDAETGKPAWRFWTIPGPGEPGSASWPGDAYLLGGGTTWMPGTYDPELDTLYWGTSNPAPDFDGAPRPGDDLYTDCVLALDPDTGKLKWYFQFTPHDLFDYDATETPVLLDTVYQGQPRKLLVEANRNGFLYVLDRTDGKFLSAIPFITRLNWAKAIDPQGRPVRTGLEPSTEGTEICPGFTGATNWFSPSYNPATHLFYFLALEDCGNFFRKPEKFSEGREYYATGVRRIRGATRQKILLAYSLDTGSFEWRYPQAGDGDSAGGTLTTAGGLVFFGDDAESFEAVEAKTGKPLWHFTTGQKFHASPMSYAVLGKQYVAVASGSDIFSFALP